VHLAHMLDVMEVGKTWSQDGSASCQSRLRPQQHVVLAARFKNSSTRLIGLTWRCRKILQADVGATANGGLNGIYDDLYSDDADLLPARRSRRESSASNGMGSIFGVRRATEKRRISRRMGFSGKLQIILTKSRSLTMHLPLRS